MFDRTKTIEKVELRKGDILVVYNSIKMPIHLQPNMEEITTSSYSSVVSQSMQQTQPN